LADDVDEIEDVTEEIFECICIVPPLLQEKYEMTMVVAAGINT